MKACGGAGPTTPSQNNSKAQAPEPYLSMYSRIALVTLEQTPKPAETSDNNNGPCRLVCNVRSNSF